MTVGQEAHPNPPWAHVVEWHASVHWKALLPGRLVSDHIIDRTMIHFTRPQAQAIKDAPAHTKS